MQVFLWDPATAKWCEAVPFNLTGPVPNQSINQTFTHFIICRGRGPFSLATVLSGFGFREKLWIWLRLIQLGKCKATQIQATHSSGILASVLQTNIHEFCYGLWVQEL